MLLVAIQDVNPEPHTGCVARQGGLLQVAHQALVAGTTLGYLTRGFFALNSLVDLFAVHSDVFRGVDPDTYLIPFDP